MIKLGLLGANISHSRSREMYEALLNQRVDYSLIDIKDKKSVPALKDLFASYNLEGLSITYPYKKHYLSDVIIEDEVVGSLNAINCIKKEGDLFYGTNTDFLAAYDLLSKKYLSEYSSFIVLGSGNMSKVFRTVFNKLKIHAQFLSRKKYGDLNNLDYASIIKDNRTLFINTCSRDFKFSPKVDLNIAFWDMNYSFGPHKNLDKKGMEYHEGIDLLHEQAKYALLFWKLGHLIKN